MRLPRLVRLRLGLLPPMPRLTRLLRWRLPRVLRCGRKAREVGGSAPCLHLSAAGRLRLRLLVALLAWVSALRCRGRCCGRRLVVWIWIVEIVVHPWLLCLLCLLSCMLLRLLWLPLRPCLGVLLGGRLPQRGVRALPQVLLGSSRRRALQRAQRCSSALEATWLWLLLLRRRLLWLLLLLLGRRRVCPPRAHPRWRVLLRCLLWRTLPGRRWCACRGCCSGSQASARRRAAAPHAIQAGLHLLLCPRGWPAGCWGRAACTPLLLRRWLHGCMLLWTPLPPRLPCPRRLLLLLRLGAVLVMPTAMCRQRPAGDAARLLLPCRSCRASLRLRCLLPLPLLMLWLRPGRLRCRDTAAAGVVWGSRRRSTAAAVLRWRCWCARAGLPDASRRGCVWAGSLPAGCPGMCCSWRWLSAGGGSGGGRLEGFPSADRRAAGPAWSLIDASRSAPRLLGNTL